MDDWGESGLDRLASDLSERGPWECGLPLVWYDTGFKKKDNKKMSERKPRQEGWGRNWSELGGGIRQRAISVLQIVSGEADDGWGSP